MWKNIVTGSAGAIAAVAILAAVEGLWGWVEVVFGPNLPSGAVVAFESKNCPKIGWEDYKLAYGRFVRGIDKSNDNIDPQGMRTPGSIQEDEFASHSHSRPKDIHNDEAGQEIWIDSEKHFSYNYGQPNTGETGGKETRPVNVALLYCKKT